jgi:KDO2-lipid IV(A) lauroyltransferase
MDKKRLPVVDFAVYLVVRLVVTVLEVLSYRWALGMADGLAWLAHRLDRRHRLVAHDNLRVAFPELGEEERDRLVRGVYRHFCRLLVQIIHTPRMLHVGNWKNHIELIGYEGMVDVVLSGRPVLMVTGHFGNWELGGYVMGLIGFQTHAIARPLDNPWLDDFLRSFRERTGQRLLAKHGDFEKMQELLERGGVLATLADQDAGQRGLFVDFFGRPASTHKAVALLAQTNNVPMVVAGMACVGEPLRFQVEVEDVIDPAEYAERVDAIPAMTQRFTSALERIVRRHPEQYFWLHRRWKHQPKAKGARKAA